MAIVAKKAVILVWALIVLIVACMGVVIWVFGPQVVISGTNVLDEVGERLMAIAVVALLGALLGLVLTFMARWKSSAGTESPTPATDAAAPGSLAKRVLDRDFRRATALLKQIQRPRFMSGSYRYELPWYVVVGPEGSGKSSFVRACGLRLPLGEKAGIVAGGPVSFLVSDQAVITETVGPFAEPGKEETWLQYIKLLKHHRSLQPVNALIMVIDLPRLVAASASARVRQFTDAREQLELLQAALAPRVPVYVVFSKVDTLPGMNQLAAGLTEEERSAVYGLTLPLYDAQGRTAKGETLQQVVDAEYSRFMHWQIPRTMRQLNTADAVSDRFDLFVLVPALQRLKPLITDFVESVFATTPFARPLLLRGLYFASAGAPPNPAGEPVSQGTFARGVMEQVILPEAGLIEQDTSAKVRQRVLLWTGALTGIACALMLAFWWTISFVANSELIETLGRAGVQAQNRIIQLRNAGPADGGGHLAEVLPALQSLRDLPTGWGDRSDKTPIILSGGLSQKPFLSKATIGEYVSALHLLLLPRLEHALTQQITANLDKPDHLYVPLRAYLMLGGAGPMNAEDVLAWFSAYVSEAYPTPADAPTRAALTDHLGNLLQIQYAPLKINDALVKSARAALNAYPPAKRGLMVISELPEVRALASWQLSDVAGPLADHALVRRSGKLLSAGIDGMYTSAAVFPVIVPAIRKVAADLAREDWVRAPLSGLSPAARLERMTQDITDLYVSAYIAEWQNILNDVMIASFDSLPNELWVLQALVGPPSPLTISLQSISRETTLAAPKPEAGKDKPGENGAPNLQAMADGITDAFAHLHRFVAGTPSPLDEVIKSLSQLRALIGPVAGSGAGNPTQLTDLIASPHFQQVMNQIRLSSRNAPPAVEASLQALLRQTTIVTSDNVRADVQSAWKTQILPFCRTAINGRYPFSVSATDATISDFSRMFAPEGLLDKFFEKQIKPFVDTSVTPWRLSSVSGSTPDITPEALAYFEQASRIRSLFFAAGGNAPQFSFTITPSDLDPGAVRVRLEIDGQGLTYQYGPPQTLQVKWPAVPPGVRVEFGATGDGQVAPIVVSGPWSLFRFLSARPLAKAGANRFKLKINQGVRSAEFFIDADSVNNPFGQNPLTGFRCLSSLVPS